MEGGAKGSSCNGKNDGCSGDDSVAAAAAATAGDTTDCNRVATIPPRTGVPEANK